MKAREAFIAGARAWKAEADLSTHRNLCKECEEGQTFSLCEDGKLLLDQAQEAKKEMMEVATLLGVTELPSLRRPTPDPLPQMEDLAAEPHDAQTVLIP